MPSLIHKKPDGTERKIEFGAKPLVIGRLPESEIPVRDSFVSRVHAALTYANGQFTLKDLGSTNGTYRNGSRIFECSLANGDKIQLGNTTLLFEIDSTTGNAILRQIPHIVAPAQTVTGPAAVPPERKQVTSQVPQPGPTSPRPPGLPPK
jgi:pSer/pThr/pTyr-binding forkhead associated (FHA) protein